MCHRAFFLGNISFLLSVLYRADEMLWGLVLDGLW